MYTVYIHIKYYTHARHKQIPNNLLYTILNIQYVKKIIAQ